MDPITMAIFGIWGVNIILEKGVLPTLRLCRGKAKRRYSCGALGDLVLSESEFKALREDHLVRLGRITDTTYQKAMKGAA